MNVGFRRDIWTYLIVSAVTILIWIWAANETRDAISATARVHLVVADPENWRVNPEQRSVSLRLEGSKLALSKAEEALRAPLRIDITPFAGVKTLDLMSELRQHSDLEATGVQILQVEPSTLELRMDEIVRSTARVRATFPRLQTAGEIEASPSEVTVAMPGLMRQQLPTELVVEPVIEQSRLDRLEPDVRHTIEVPLRLAEGLVVNGNVTIYPPTSKLSFIVRSRIQELTLDSVRVQLAGPPEDHRDYLVEVEDTVLRDVTIRADTSLINRIESREAMVVAVVHVSSREKEQGIDRKAVSYFLVLSTLENGMTRGQIVEAEVAGSSDPPIVRLRIERKDSM